MKTCVHALRSLVAPLTVSVFAVGCASGPDPKAIEAKLDHLIAQHNVLAAAFKDHTDSHARLAERVRIHARALDDNNERDKQREARWLQTQEDLNRSLHEHEVELRNAIAVLRRLQVIRPTPDGPPMLVIRDR